MRPHPFASPKRKLEIRLHAGSPSLRALGDTFWHSAAGAAGARVLSRVSNGACDAYLLSESSLFVFDARAILITCGATPLDAAASYLRSGVREDYIASVADGNARQPGDGTVDVLVRDLDPALCALVASASDAADPSRVRQALGFDRLFAGFLVDEHVFQPPGYSLNAIDGEHYCAVHVSPDHRASYASIETNWPGADRGALAKAFRAAILA